MSRTNFKHYPRISRQRTRTTTKNLSQHSRRHGWDSNREIPHKILEGYLLGHAAGGWTDNRETTRMCESLACRGWDYINDTTAGLP